MKKTIYILSLLLSITFYAQESRVTLKTTKNFISENLSQSNTLDYNEDKSKMTITTIDGEVISIHMSTLKDVQCEDDKVIITYTKGKIEKKVKLYTKSQEMNFRVVNAILNLQKNYEDTLKEEESKNKDELFLSPRENCNPIKPKSDTKDKANSNDQGKPSSNSLSEQLLENDKIIKDLQKQLSDLKKPAPSSNTKPATDTKPSTDTKPAK